MERSFKWMVGAGANLLLRIRGYRFPAYFHDRDRLHVLFFGIEPDVSRFLRKRLRPGMTVLDVGGNVGLICRICAAEVGRTGRVVTFEPDPATRVYLEHNVKRCPNVTVSAVALSDENCVAKLHLHPGSGTANSLLAFEASSGSVEVECMTLDTFLMLNPGLSPNCIKIDVEGAEPKVFAGMRQTLKLHPEVFLVVEFCPSNLANGGYRPEDYFKQIEELGLSVELIRDDGSTVPVVGVEELMRELKGEIYCNLYCFHKA